MLVRKCPLQASELPADFLQVVLGLLLCFLCGLLGVGTRLQFMDGLGQAVSFLSVSGLAARHIRTGVHTGHVGAEAIEIYCEIVAGVKRSKASI